jgi:D-tyrosyl-tRNA(Tyr) deacylase
VDKMINKLLAYRVFADEQGKMNLSVADINGGVLVVSQFTLVADTKSRPEIIPIITNISLYSEKILLIKSNI